MPLFTYFFLGWVGLGLRSSRRFHEIIYLVLRSIRFPTQQNLVNRKTPSTQHHLVNLLVQTFRLGIGLQQSGLQYRTHQKLKGGAARVYLIYLKGGVILMTHYIDKYAYYERRLILTLDLHIRVGFIMPRFGKAPPSATRPPAPARPCHAHPTQQPSGSPRKNGPQRQTRRAGRVERRRPRPPTWRGVAKKTWKKTWKSHAANLMLVTSASTINELTHC